MYTIKNLYDAIYNNLEEVVTAILTENPALANCEELGDNELSQSPLILASSLGRLNVVNLLLLQDADAAAHNNGALRWAIIHSNANVVERLLQIPNVDATANNNCAILWATRNGHLDVVERLLQ